MNRKAMISVLFITSFLSVMTYAKTIKLKSNNIDAIIKEMTLDEKVALLVGTGMDLGDGNAAPVVGATDKIVPGAAGTNNAIARLGV
jgi:beta-glucosidase